MKPLMSDLSSTTRRCGVEVELTAPMTSITTRHNVQNALASLLTDNQLPAISRGYTNNVPLPDETMLAVEYDSSIAPPAVYVQGQRVTGVSYAQIELKSKICSIDEFDHIIPKAIEILRSIGCRASGGLHVHVGVDEIKTDPSRIRSIYNLLHRVENILYALQPASRSTTTYANPLPDKSRLLHGCRTPANYRRALNHLGRHYGVKFTHLWEAKPHLEYRQAASSLNSQKVKGWVYTCLQLIEHSMKRNCQASRQKIPNSRNGLEKMLMACGFKSCTGIYDKVADPRIIETRRWLVRRWKQLNEH